MRGNKPALGARRSLPKGYRHPFQFPNLWRPGEPFNDLLRSEQTKESATKREKKDRNTENKKETGQQTNTGTMKGRKEERKEVWKKKKKRIDRQ